MQKSILFFFSLLIAAGFAANAQAINWSYNGHDYFLIEKQNVSWDAALQDIKDNYDGYSLAAITSSSEQAFVKSVLKSAGVKGEYWLGGYQVKLPNADKNDSNYMRLGWEWVTGEVWEDDMTQWAAGEPNDYYGPDSEQHLAMWSRFGWDWNDEGALRNIDGYIAESTQPMPEPSTVVLLGIGMAGLAGFGRRKIFKP